MARGEGCVGILSSSCPCWGADHLWAIVAPRLGDIGDGGAVHGLAVGDFMSFAF